MRYVDQLIKEIENEHKFDELIVRDAYIDPMEVVLPNGKKFNLLDFQISHPVKDTDQPIIGAFRAQLIILFDRMRVSAGSLNPSGKGIMYLQHRGDLHLVEVHGEQCWAGTFGMLYFPNESLKDESE